MNSSGVIAQKDVIKDEVPGPRQKPYYVQLAVDEQAAANDASDEETYNLAYHNRETDICDSSDDDDLSDTLSETSSLEIVEYDIRSSSEEEAGPNDSIFTESSAEEMDICVTIVKRKVCTDESESEYEIWADTEASDDVADVDPELGCADYWECVKCKNKQNNPMYRYCEKCFQLRKSHFPPRPKRKKNRQRHRNLGRYTKNEKTDTTEHQVSENGKENLYLVDKSTSLHRNVTQSSKRKHRLSDSAGESATSSDSDCDATATASHPPTVKKLRFVSPEPETTSEPPLSLAKLLPKSMSQTDEFCSLPQYLSMQLSAKDSGFSSGGSQDPSYLQGSSSQEFTFSDEEKLAAELKQSKSDAFMNEQSEQDLCAICKVSPKSAVFVHTIKACSGSCYACALKTWKRYKSCPFCREKPKNVMKLFSH